MVFVEINVDFVQSEVVADPLQAFARGLKLRKIIVKTGLNAHDRGNHSIRVHNVLIGDRGDPTGGTHIDMCHFRAHATSANADQCRITASGKDGYPLTKSEIGGRFFQKCADLCR